MRWRFDEKCLKNALLVKEVTEELEDRKTPEDWDLCKLKIQSIIRAFKKPKALEGKIMQLNRKLIKLKKTAARDSSKENILQKIEELQTTLREKLGQLLETWHKKSKAH